MRNERKQSKHDVVNSKYTPKPSSYWYVDRESYQRLLDDYNELNQDKKEVESYY